MKKYIKAINARAILTVAILIISFTAIAQAPPDPLDDDPGTTAPIDGGVSLLVAAGIGYGAKKVHEMRKKKSATEKEQ